MQRRWDRRLCFSFAASTFLPSTNEKPMRKRSLVVHPHLCPAVMLGNARIRRTRPMPVSLAWLLTPQDREKQASVTIQQLLLELLSGFADHSVPISIDSRCSSRAAPGTCQAHVTPARTTNAAFRRPFCPSRVRLHRLTSAPYLIKPLTQDHVWWQRFGS